MEGKTADTGARVRWKSLEPSPEEVEGDGSERSRGVSEGHEEFGGSTERQ